MRRLKATPVRAPTGGSVRHYVILPPESVTQQSVEVTTSAITPSEGEPAYVLAYPWPDNNTTTNAITTEWAQEAAGQSEERADVAGSTPPKCRKKRRTASLVWEHFTQHGSDKLAVECNHCGANVRLAKPGGIERPGTTAMHRHVRVHHPELLPEASTAPSSDIQEWLPSTGNTFGQQGGASCGTESSRRRRSSSFVWDHFDHHALNKCLVVCKHCRLTVRLGKEGGCDKLGTTAMHRHVLVHHSLELTKKPGSRTKAAGDGSDSKVAKVAAVSSRTLNSHSSTRVASGNRTIAAESQKPWEPTHRKVMVHNQRLAEYIAKSLKPFSVVEEPAFVEFMHFCVPQWKIPNSDYFACMALPALATTIRHTIKNQLRHCIGKAVHLSIDLWSCHHAKDYLSIVMYWMSQDDSRGSLTRHRAVLDMSGAGGSHTGTSIAQRLGMVTDEWLVPLTLRTCSVVADSSPDVVQALDHVGLKHTLCTAHCISTVVKGLLSGYGADVEDAVEAARSICRHLHNNEEARARLKELQCRNGLKPFQLVEDKSTYWESTLLMIERLCEQQPTISECCEGYSESNLTPEQWTLLNDLISVLRPFKEVAHLLSMNNSTLGQVLPLLRFAEKMLQTIHQKSWKGSPASQFSLHLLEKLRASRHLQALKADMAQWAASFLDPRFRDTFGMYTDGVEGSIDEKLKSLKGYLLDEILDCYLRQKERCDDSTTIAPAPPTVSTSVGSSAAAAANFTNEFSLWLSNAEEMGLTVARAEETPDRARADGMSIAKAQLDAYVQDSISDFSAPLSDPARYWEKKREHWPYLYAVAVKYLSCPPTGAYAEQAFGKYGPIAAEGRKGLSADSMSMLCFVRMNGAWVPQDPTAAPADVLDGLYKAAANAQPPNGETEYLESACEDPLLQRAVCNE